MMWRGDVTFPGPEGGGVPPPCKQREKASLSALLDRLAATEIKDVAFCIWISKSVLTMTYLMKYDFVILAEV
jgi:hypothetical protein